MKTDANHSITIDGRQIGNRCRPYIVAEISGNHGGELGRALKLIEAAKAAGADAVKFQTYTPDTMTIDSNEPEFVVRNKLWEGKTLYQLYKEAHTPYEWHEELFARARAVGITPISSPFDETAVDLLESLDAPAYKIASSEIVDVNLIHYAAKTGKPIILSTGMADFAEIKEALTACKEAGNTKTLLLHCVAGYPTPKEQANLATLSALKQFECLVGLSDHSEGADVSAAAIAAGAVLVEKHFCLSRDIKTVDSDFSLDPDELAMLVARCRETWSMIGCVLDGPADVENQARAYRRSLYATRAVKKGEILTTSNIKSIRPSNGLHPRYLKLLLGTRSKRALKAGEPLRTDDLPST